MRSSAALLVAVLLAVSAVSGVGVALPADDRVRAPDALSGSDFSERTPTGSTLPERTPSHSNLSPPNETGSNATNSNATRSNVTARDETEMYVSLHEDGTAQWNVTAHFVLGDENETAAFRDLAESYENGNSDAGFSARTFERVVEHASADAGRPMTVRNVTRSARLLENGSVGVLSLSFTWTNFTRIDGRQIVLGDVFWVGSETWLPVLSDDQTLVIEAPDAYYISSASPSGGSISDGKVLRYEGPQKFDSGDFAMTYSPKNTATTTTTTPSSDFPDFPGPSWVIILAVLFSVGGIGSYAWSQRQNTDPVGDAATATGSPPTAPATGEADDEGDASDASDESDADETDEPSTELLSDEERVLRLLRDNDGRMKQAQIVKETNWSNAKVSQLLSKMEGNDAVDKLRIGRENLITLPDEDVTDTE